MPSYASLKVPAETKRELELLQAEMLTELGEKMSLHELVDRAVRLARRQKLRLLDWKPLTDTEWNEVLKLVTKTGDTRGEEQIDEDIYGGEV